MNSKEQYTQLVSTLDLPYYLQPWWLDAVSAAQSKYWDAAIALSASGELLAAMPFHVVQRLGFRFAMNPQLTPYTDVWINRNLVRTPGERLAAVQQIVGQLRKAHISAMCFIMPEDFACAAEFEACGFKLTYRHTYIIDDISEPDELLLLYHNMKRRQVQKAQRNLVAAVGDISPSEYYEFYSQCLARRGQKIFYQKDFFCATAQRIIDHGQANFFTVRDVNGNLLAVLFATWDSLSGYALSYAYDNAMRNTGASALMMHSAIEYLSTRTHSFDFEGGNAKHIGDSYSKFATRCAICPKISGSFSPVGRVLRRIVFGE